LGEKATHNLKQRFDLFSIGYFDKEGEGMGHYDRISRRSFIKKLGSVGLLVAAGTVPTPAYANVPAVSLDARDLGDMESEITVKVFHKGNNLFHHVDRVGLFADGEEIKVWNYSWRQRPESENFSVKLRVRVTRKTLYSAVANCNLHGENKDRGTIQLSP
jgi:desulfoferrodoxin (superoxide reductase-like protein)